MRVEEHTSTEQVRQGRERFVPRGVATSDLVVTRAWGARIWDADGREYIDFAGGIACQNLGHGNAAVVRAVHEQVDRYLHQCFMVGMYEPYVAVAEKLDELWPGKAATKTLLLNSGAEAIENAVKVARTATGRPSVIVFDRAFHGRTNLTMAMTSKLVYKQGFGPFAGSVYRAPAPYPYRGVTTEDAMRGLLLLFKQDVDPADVACIVLEPVQGEGGFIPMPPEFVHALRELCDAHDILYVDDEVQSGCGRTGAVWAIEHYGVEPDLIVSGKTLGGGLPLAGGRLRSRTRGARRAVGAGLPGARRADRAVAPRTPRRDRGQARNRRRGARPRSDARARARRADRRCRPGRDDCCARERARPALVRPLRQCDPAPAAAVGDGR